MNSVFYYPYSLNIWQNWNVSKDLDHLISIAKADKKILLWSIEFMKEDFLRYVLDCVVSKNLMDRVFWILQPSHRIPSDIFTLLGNKLFLIDSDLLVLNLQCNECVTSTPNCCWNPTTGRFLFLTGKPNKPNRIQLLYKFHSIGLLDRCDWSLFVDDHTFSQSRQLLPELSDIEFQKFVDQHNRNLDDIEIYHCTPDSNHSNGYPFDGSVYQRTSFRVISETMLLHEPITTEKTWITVANNMPFIMAGYSGMLRYLKECGYRTFENFLPIKDYDQIQNLEDRFEAVIENTKFWLSNIENQADAILKDVEHNRRLLDRDLEKNLQRAKDLACALGEPERSVYSLFPIMIEQHQWVIFYYNIKDPAWPDCLVEQDFKKLPLRIQKECVDQFGYHPKK